MNVWRKEQVSGTGTTVRRWMMADSTIGSCAICIYIIQCHLALEWHTGCVSALFLIPTPYSYSFRTIGIPRATCPALETAMSDASIHLRYYNPAEAPPHNARAIRVGPPPEVHGRLPHAGGSDARACYARVVDFRVSCTQCPKGAACAVLGREVRAHRYGRPTERGGLSAADVPG